MADKLLAEQEFVEPLLQVLRVEGVSDADRDQPLLLLKQSAQKQGQASYEEWYMHCLRHTREKVRLACGARRDAGEAWCDLPRRRQCRACEPRAAPTPPVSSAAEQSSIVCP